LQKSQLFLGNRKEICQNTAFDFDNYLFNFFGKTNEIGDNKIRYKKAKNISFRKKSLLE